MRRREMVFLILFLGLLGAGFALLSYAPVNDHLVEPFTALVAKASGGALRLLGQPVEMDGTVIRGPRFAVNIRNGCNGLETLIIFVSAVLAFPAPWRSRILGLVLGSVAIQAINLVRVVALYFTGAYAPAWFDSSHTVIWQTIVILCGVLLWVFWATRFVPRPAPAER
jgi:exosortase H (IPTLxxWG-CTERM-specific)